MAGERDPETNLSNPQPVMYYFQPQLHSSMSVVEKNVSLVGVGPSNATREI